MIIAVGGPSCSGKTTLCSWLHYLVETSQILRQDDYFKSDSDIPIQHGISNWDCPDALHMDKFRNRIIDFKNHPQIHADRPATPDSHLKSLKELKNEFSKISQIPVLIVDGFMLYDDPRIYSTFDICIFLTASKEVLKERREAREGYVTTEGYWADPKDYFDNFVWPQYLKYNQKVFDGKVPGIISLSSESGGIEKMVKDAINLILERI